MKWMMRGGDYYIPVEVTEEDSRLFFKFPFNRPLMEEIKSLEGRKWHPEEKMWSALNTPRNQFSLQYLRQDCEDPYARFDAPIEDIDTERPLWEHQRKMLSFFLTRRTCLLAAEQGTGKSLALIELMERSGLDGDEIYYVSTRPGLEAMRLELKKWNSTIKPVMFSYDGLKKVEMSLRQEDGLYGVPKMLIGDESSRLKNKETGRTKSFRFVADVMRGVIDTPYIIECTGTPAPHSPVDWWAQCEIAQPGFIKESHPSQFQKTLALVEYIDNGAFRYPHVITWWDDENKCAKCGDLPNSIPCDRHDCEYSKSVNEMDRFYKRASGLVYVMKKADCLDLPDKHYRQIHITPSDKVKEEAKAVIEEKESKIEVLSALRCLSDGHKYYDEEIGKQVCPICSGCGESYNDDVINIDEFEAFADTTEDTCWACEGTGEVPKYRRTFEEIDDAKLKKVRELLNEFEDVGRCIIYAAYHASIDRISKLALEMGWTVMQVDGRGWVGKTPSGDIIPKDKMVEQFQLPVIKRDDITKNIVWVAHPESSGTGLTLTASPVEVFYSNSFRADDRLQAEDRAHRHGMDLNKGLTVIDLIHLETDELVFDNLANKRFLQDLTMGIIKEKLKL